MEVTIAVDIGGTRIRAAVFPEEGTEPLVHEKIATQGDGIAPVERLMRLIAGIWPGDARVRAIGLAAPGPLDPVKGILYAAPNIPGWDNLPLRALLEDRFNTPVLLGNDANLAGLGEWRYGAGRGHDDVLYLTISTGIGGGVISGGRMLLGAQGLAAELGHLTVDPNGPLCGCGKYGHLEAFSSGTAIAHFVWSEQARGAVTSLPLEPRPTTIEIASAAAHGDALALAAFQRAGHYLGIGLANYLHVFNPSVVIFGGGVSRSGELLFAPMRAALAEQVMDPAYLQNLIITPAELGDNTGLFGALALARHG